MSNPDSNKYFFQLLKDKKKKKEVVNNDLKIAHTASSQAYQLNGHTNNMVYQTIKSIIMKAKNDQLVENVKKINIEWEEFKNFSPI